MDNFISIKAKLFKNIKQALKTYENNVYDYVSEYNNVPEHRFLIFLHSDINWETSNYKRFKYSATHIKHYLSFYDQIQNDWNTKYNIQNDAHHKCGDKMLAYMDVRGYDMFRKHGMKGLIHVINHDIKYFRDTPLDQYMTWLKIISWSRLLLKMHSRTVDDAQTKEILKQTIQHVEHMDKQIQKTL